MGIQEYDFIAQIERLAASLGLRGWLTVVALLILGGLYMGARISDWHELAKHYASAERYQGRWISQLDDSGQGGGLEVSIISRSIPADWWALGDFRFVFVHCFSAGYDKVKRRHSEPSYFP